MNRRRWMYSAGLLAATLGLGAAPAGAQTSGGGKVGAATFTSAVTITNNNNGTVTYSVDGIVPFGPVTFTPTAVTAGPTCLPPATLTTAYTTGPTGSTGTASVTVNLLAANPNGGTQTVVASDPDGSSATSGTFVCPAVLGTVVENTDPNVLGTVVAPGSGLPRTGSDIKAPIGFALVLLVSGGALVIGTRRARKAPVRVRD